MSERIVIIIILILSSGIIIAQGPEDPPRPITITVSQELSFGSFYHGASGGTVIVDPAVSRTSTGDVVLLFPGVFAVAIFDIIGNAGTVITLTNGPDAILTDGTGGSMSMHIDSSVPSSPFVLTSPYPVATQIYVGATLTVGPPISNPPGAYSGNFEITFNQQ